MVFRRLAATACLATLVLFTAGWFFSQSEAAKPQKDAAVERTRKQVRMLDDLYKTAVVLITENYVNDDDDLPAGAAAIALFDATGEPLNDENSPKDSFEREAVKRLKAGQDYHDQVVERDGNRYLRAATPIPVVLQKCTMCHKNYKQAKPGEPIGSLSYTILIE